MATPAPAAAHNNQIVSGNADDSIGASIIRYLEEARMRHHGGRPFGLTGGGRGGSDGGERVPPRTGGVVRRRGGGSSRSGSSS